MKSCCVYETDTPDRRLFQRANNGNLHEIQPVLQYPDISSPSVPIGGFDHATLAMFLSTQHNFFSPHEGFRKPSIIRNPLITIGDIDDPYKFALSEVSLGDLDMAL